MQDILDCAMGLDVHRDVIVACLTRGAPGTEPEIELRSFSTLIPEMQKLRDWVVETECRYVAMESTRIYWQPIYEMLEPCFEGEINILVVNAQHMRDAIAEEIVKHSEALNLLCSIPGIDDTAAASIIAEIGTDMSAFPDSQYICSWAGLSPGNDESAGKRKRAHINKGNPYVKSMLCEVDWIIAGKRKLYLSGWY